MISYIIYNSTSINISNKLGYYKQTIIVRIGR